MKAILETTGPVAIPKSVKAVKMSLNILTTKQFFGGSRRIGEEKLWKTFKDFNGIKSAEYLH